MGCWYATCGLSGLPILPRDKAVFILLGRHGDIGTQDLDKDDYGHHRGSCEPDDLWTPLGWPIFGTYSDDEGMIVKPKVPAPKLYAAGMKHYGVKVGVKAMLEQARSGTLVVNHIMAKRWYRLAGHVLVRQDVWDLALSMDFDDWPKSMSANRYDGVKGFVQRLFDRDQKLKELIAKNTPVGEVWRCEFDFDNKEEDSEDGFPRHVFRTSKMLVHALREVVSKGVPVEEVEEAARAMADMYHLHNVMRGLRRSWAPGVACGSQTIELRMHETFLQGLTGIAKARADKYEDDCNS